MSSDSDEAPQLSRSSFHCISREATPNTKHNCNSCAINTLRLTKLQKQLKELQKSYKSLEIELINKEKSYDSLQSEYKQKCKELEETETYYVNIYDQKCKELVELQESLNAIFYNTRHQQSTSLSTPSSMNNIFNNTNNINHNNTHNNNAHNNNNNNHFGQQHSISITPTPSITTPQSMQTVLVHPSPAPTSSINHTADLDEKSNTHHTMDNNNGNMTAFNFNGNHRMTNTQNLQNIGSQTVFTKRMHSNNNNNNEMTYNPQTNGPFMNHNNNINNNNNIISNNNMMSMVPNPGILRQITSCSQESVLSQTQSEQTQDTDDIDDIVNDYVETELESMDDPSRCLNVNRIFEFLKQYEKEPIQFERVYRTKITNILNDYHHILNSHCNQYKQIYLLLPMELKCNILNCKHIKINKKKTTNKRMKTCQLIGDIMIMIHIYICHSYDIGYRNIKNDDDDITNITIKLNEKQITAKRNLISKIRGFKTKYFDEYNRFETNRNNHQRNNKQNKHKNKNVPILSATTILPNKQCGNYAFGEKYYYWNDYKNHEMFVEQKAKNLKHEIQDHYLTVKEYLSVMRKAEELIKTDIAKQTYANIGKYDINKGMPLQIENIIVIFMYSRYDKLCYSFCETFRKNNNNESLLSMKKRNANYWWISKILRETVECYGTMMKDTKIKKYYHGTKDLKFDLFVVKLKGPISTTTSMDVATIFSSRNGYIVEFTEYSPNLRYFNCSWISPFSGEAERLFFGGNGSLQIVNIRLLKTNKNCKYYIKAIRNFHCFLRGSELRCDYDDSDDEKEAILSETIRRRDTVSEYKMEVNENKSNNINDDDQIIITSLIDQYLSIQLNEFPEYINHIFSMFCKRRKEIYINIDDMYEYYESFVSIFWSDIFNLLRFDKIIKLFPNCIKITIVTDNDGEYNIIDKEYVNSLLIILKSCNEIIKSEKRYQISLQSIFIQKVKYETISHSLSTSTSTSQFIPKFNKIGWELNIEQAMDLDTDQLQNWSFNRKKQSESVMDKLTKLQLV